MELMRRRYVVRMSFLVILASGCASVHTGQDAQQVLAGETPKPGVTKGGLRISGEEDTAHSSLYFGLINLTFENKSDKWINISNLRISFLKKTADAKAEVLVGNRLANWAEATQRLDLIRRHNRQVALGTLGVVGVVGAGVGASKGANLAEGAGEAAAIGSLTSLAITDLADHVRDLENPDLVPANHLLAGDFEVPPGLFVKRFIVIDTSHENTPKLEKLRMTYTIDGVGEEVVDLSFRSGSSIWQDWH